MRSRELLRGSEQALVGVAIFSALINLLYLTGSFYMLQVYDRVIPSRSVDTLIALSVLAGLLFAGQGALDIYRTRILLRVGRAIDERLSPRVFSLIGQLPLTGRATLGLQPMRDLDNIRTFFANGGPSAFFDLPWAPLYIGICFLFHPAVGLIALAGVLLLAFLTALAEIYTRAPMTETAAHSVSRNNFAEAARRNAEVVTALGMGARMRERWMRTGDSYLDGHQRASDISSGFSGLSKMARMALQSAALGVGALLVIKGEATGGVIIAGSILAARALAPIELMIMHYKSFVSARQSWKRLGDLLVAYPEKPAPLALPRPSTVMSVENLAVSPPGSQRIVAHGVSFELPAGAGLGVIGPSASGKSCLARALVGVWAPARGSVRLDGAALDQWSPEALGAHIGYLPQDIELFEGTIAENIARFNPAASDETIIRAAEQAGVHSMIVRLPKGYETQIGQGGVALSGGQKQRIGLARALYGDPFLLVLDEPNSNLDAVGDQALTQAILDFRARGGIAIMIAHRPSALEVVDQVLVLANGEVKAFGPKDKVLRPLARPAPLRAAEAS
ncbi:MAG: putative transporter family, HlyB subfamily [Hyphomicrobiales bacterium]|nr:putative transporter family, HlyB subfamily [Hyphomicrobiales bacterium]